MRDVMLGKGIPDPRDIRKYDLVGAMGMVNYKLLEASLVLQVRGDDGGDVTQDGPIP